MTTGSNIKISIGNKEPDKGNKSETPDKISKSRNLIQKVQETHRKTKNLNSGVSLPPTTLLAAIRVGAAAAASPWIGKKGADDARETGKFVEDILKYLLNDNFVQLKKHLSSPEFRVEVGAARKGIKKTMEGIKEARKLALEAGTEFIHDTESLGKLTDELLAPLGIDFTKLESAACDEILGILEISAFCVEIMAVQKSAELAANKVEQGFDRMNNVAAQVQVAGSKHVKGNRTMGNRTKRNRTKRNRTKRNRTKRNRTKRNRIKRDRHL